MANYTNVIASNICDASGNKLASGTVSFQATDAANQPLNFQVGGGGQVVTTPATAAIVAGAIAGGFQVADSANTSPAGVLYRITVTDTTLNRVVVAYSLVTVTGTTFSLDNYTPLNASVLPPIGGSVNGPLTVNGNLSVTGALSLGSFSVGALSASDLITSSTPVVDVRAYANIQAAVNFAAGLSPKGVVQIPYSYVGVDSYTNASNVLVIDERGGNFTLPSGMLQVFHIIRPVQPAPQAPTFFPKGNDLSLVVEGTGDLWLNTLPVTLTSTTSVSPGSVTITVGDTSQLCIPAAGCSLDIEPLDTVNPNHEVITSANWSIISSTQITATFAKSHTQPFTVRQKGSIPINTNLITVQNDDHNPTLVADSNLFNFMRWPYDVTGTWPLSGVVFYRDITGDSATSSNHDFRIRNYATTGSFILVPFGATPHRLSIDDNGNSNFGGNTPALAAFGSVQVAGMQLGKGFEAIGTSFYMQTPSLDNGHPSGFGVDGTFSSFLTSINLRARGVFSNGGFNSRFSFFTTSNTVENEAARLDKAGLLSTLGGLACNGIGGTMCISPTAPTISSGFGTSPSIVNNNGTAAFVVNVGTGGVATSGVIGMPTAATGWNCYPNNITAAAAHRADNTRQTASTTTSVTIENQTTSTGAALAWTASDIVRMKCTAY